MEDFDKYLEFQKELAKMTLKLAAKYQKKSAGSLRLNQLELVEEILIETGKPLHINEIIEIAQSDYNVILNRDSITSAIAKKMKTDSVFMKTSPNTFYIKSEIESKI